MDSLKRIRVIADKLPGYEWVWRLRAARPGSEVPEGDSRRQRARVCDLATPDGPPIHGPVVIVAGGCDKSVEQQMQGYRQLLIEAFKDFTGTILSGGTTQGIAGLVGDHSPAATATGCTRSATSRSWCPPTPRSTVDPDRYDEIRRTNGSGFSPLEPLQNWIDLLAAGIEPKDVKLLGINGGTIAAAEYRIAAALGARVVLLEKSGREAAKVFTDPDWEGSPNLVGMPGRCHDHPRLHRLWKIEALGRNMCDVIARGIHEAYRRNKTQPSVDPSMADWEQLREDLKNSNREQANHIFEKLREIACTVKPLEGSQPARVRVYA